MRNYCTKQKYLIMADNVRGNTIFLNFAKIIENEEICNMDRGYAATHASRLCFGCNSRHWLRFYGRRI